jgi:hypothetical protein
MIGAALLIAAQLVPAPAEPKPVATTIAAIRANPKKLDGQVVRLTGWVNSCQPLSCGIEERPSASAGGAGARLSIGENKKFDDVIRPLLPTYVEFDARLNAACLTTQNCTDRAPVLNVVSLRSVVSPEPPEIEN